MTDIIRFSFFLLHFFFFLFSVPSLFKESCQLHIVKYFEKNVLSPRTVAGSIDDNNINSLHDLGSLVTRNQGLL